MAQQKRASLWTKNFILITLINLLIYLSWQMFPSALPPFVKGLGGANSVLGWINGISTVATLIIRPIAGSIMDKRGRKGIFAFGLAFLVLTTWMFLWAPAVWAILALRFFHGLAWGIASTGSNTVATDNIPPENMSQGMTYYGLSISISSGIAPMISLSPGIAMSQVIWIGTIFVVLAFLLNTQIDYPPHEAHPSAKHGAPYEGSAVLPSVMISLITITYGAILTFVSLYGKQRGIEGLGMFFTLYAIGMLVTRLFLGRIIKNFGMGVAIVPAGLMVAVSLLLLARAESYGLFLLTGFLYGIGYGVLHTSLQTMSVSGVDTHRLGAANATFLTGFDGGMGVGSILAGLLVAKLGYSGMYGVLAICPLLVVVLYLVFGRGRQRAS